MITASPKPLQCSAVSTRTSPVTQTADVAVNSASSPFVHARDSDAQGSDSSAVPTRIAAPKAPTRYHGVGRSRIMRRGRCSAKTSVFTRRRRSTTSPGRRAGRSRGVRAAPPPRPPPRPSRAAARCHAARSHARGRTAIASTSPATIRRPSLRAVVAGPGVRWPQVADRHPRRDPTCPTNRSPLRRRLLRLQPLRTLAPVVKEGGFTGPWPRLLPWPRRKSAAPPPPPPPPPPPRMPDPGTVVKEGGFTGSWPRLFPWPRRRSD